MWAYSMNFRFELTPISNALVLTGLAKIWVQLGCVKTSRGFPRAPRVAIGALKLQLLQ